ncbi:Nramp family divalent metal transporter [Streptomyces sp. NPDC020362]|uniref:Nramp family divalent metal transporter n=1 Tax=unclassified Streptomyces TaxID=2593676 RepID=UPI0033C5845D
MGPAFLAAVAYIDPGNFATDVESGADTGYQLLWVVLAAGCAAVPVQYLSAKLGIVTGKSLPESCRRRFGPRVSAALWIQAEITAMATDLAEFTGSAIALQLLFHMGPLVSALVTGGISYFLLDLYGRRRRSLERLLTLTLALLLLAFAYLTARGTFDAGAAASGLLPSVSGANGAFLAVGIIGATLMPHAIYLHSALVTDRVFVRDPERIRAALRAERSQVFVALGVANAVNLLMLAMAAGVLQGASSGGLSLAETHRLLGTLLGGGAATVFALALLAAGLSSSGVGTLAGQVVMSGFVGRRVPAVLRRTVTMVPALVAAAAGCDPTQVLIVSQVVLAFGILPALVPLLMLTSDRRLMGEFAVGRAARAGMSVLAGAIAAVNLLLVWLQVVR